MEGTQDGLDPRLEQLRFDLNALVLWEENSGKTIDKFNPKSMKELRLLMWCGMKSQVPDLTLEQVGAMMTYRNRGGIRAVIDRKMVEAGLVEEKNEEARPTG